MREKKTLHDLGGFLLGCNYWASHAGTAMWRDWRPDVVESDLKQLKASGNDVLRVFPLWPDFQPLVLLRRAGGKPTEYRFGDIDALPRDVLGKAGMSKAAMQRFEQFLHLASKSGTRVIVGLITGWMSGRLFVPPALEGRNLLTDPVSVMWQTRFVRCFADYFKGFDAIIAWELGNECNCMETVGDRESAWLWVSALANAIRTADPGRPVLSGMHGLMPKGVWAIGDQAELLDVLTTHTYPVFTEYCDSDPVPTIRPILHSTAETRLMADLSGKPCFVEEFGTLGPMTASDRIAADFTRTCLYSLWAHHCGGLLWWCAYDQWKLPFPPYEWNATECELGMFTCGDPPRPKPVADEIKAFSAFLKNLPFERLPDYSREAVCVLSSNRDFWGIAYSAFILAKQAGFDLEFQYHDQPLKKADLYLLPCIEGINVMKQRDLEELLANVRNGAVLYISGDNGKLRHFKEVTGLEVQTNERRTRPEEIVINLDGETLLLQLASERKLTFKAAGASVLGYERDGNPAFSEFSCGNGKIYFLPFPLELELARTAAAFHSDEAAPCWKIYRHLAKRAMAGRCAIKSVPNVGVTEHPVSNHERILILINYSPVAADCSLRFQGGWELAGALHGGSLKVSEKDTCVVSVGHNDACILKVTRGEA